MPAARGVFSIGFDSVSRI